MVRDRDRDGDESSAPSQSRRPPLNHQESDSTNSDQAHRDHHQQHRSKSQKHVVGGGRLHARVPSSKALHKHHGSTASKLNNHRRQASPSPDRNRAAAGGHRRVQSEAKLSRDSSSANLSKTASTTSLRRNKSHGEVNKPAKIKSVEKLKRTSSNPAVNKVKSQKSQVHFDLGNDGQDDEWVDASTSASPYLSRRGSLASTQASAKPDDSSANNSASNFANNSRAETPAAQSSPLVPATPDRETVQHKAYLTSRLLQRTPSHGAPPKMTADTVSLSRRGHSSSPDSIGRGSTLGDSHNVSTLPGSAGDELISRFVNAGSSGAAREGSFYHPTTPGPASLRSEENSRGRPQSSGSGGQGKHRDLPMWGDEDGESAHESRKSRDSDGTALAPRSGRRFAPPAEKSRTQQKLNLQRASSVIEPGQAVGGGVGAVGASPLVGIGGPGYDGGASRDPRVAKQLERTGMEYLSVRRFQNPVVRSLDRLAQVNRANKNQRIPRNGAANGNGKAASVRGGVAPGGQHMRNSSLNEAALVAAASGGTGSTRRPVTPRAYSIRTNGAGSSYEADGDDHQNSRALHEGTGVQGLSGSSLVGGEEDEGITAILRNLWEKNPDLSASQE
ncbi:hypothetical protein CORC01_11253 [Colletotrichum orchidophilum]|uniref:Uncharacterized protein n=1 Tax=Colletotrichum orchidophilum TaxID=1209926 RepID=A0A1G4AWD5_9PEZI|nr:uncharacterized protein CORC01_11253 [Colletotrichum orchidophilum]OHE93478.1 hypothetical protein CORC01_11253 [Colletotrichum orchidophilum]